MNEANNNDDDGEEINDNTIVVPAVTNSGNDTPSLVFATEVAASATNIAMHDEYTTEQIGQLPAAADYGGGGNNGGDGDAKAQNILDKLAINSLPHTTLGSKQDPPKNSLGDMKNKNDHEDATARRCAECGEEGGVSLKMCKACMHARYCNAACQMNHWPKHKKECKLRAAILRDEALFKDPPDKEDCPICFLPMPVKLICCASLPPATISSVPLYDFAIANTELASKGIGTYYPCCGKSICRGCEYSFDMSGNDDKCPFCNSDRGKTEEEDNEDLMKRVEANDAASIYLLADSYYQGLHGLQQDHARAIELFTRAAELGFSKAHSSLGGIYHEGGNMKKAKFHCEAAAMAGHEVARCNLGIMEDNSGNMERAVKHWTIAASAGHYGAMHVLRTGFEGGEISRKSIDSTLAAYNRSCVEMRSKARDVYIRRFY